ncbi:MAG: hypothetical protein A3J29_22305 [Acidobacteria bacterium RIFCSPLOWO2_12_FULL_67_14b]|nr:MAG: hypothetical protein A3J29_22305 [Acidobacteria bacterium RIFCSPLOWO2_12_FULL_67_14b]
MLLPFFQWLESLWLGQFIVSSNWLFPVIESVHLLALAVLGGAILVVDMRLLGLGLKNHAVTQIAREARPWLVGALVVMIATGVPLFLSEAVKCYYSQAFWNKMTALALGLVFTFTVRARATETESVRHTARRQAVVGALSLALWFTVAASGRWIGFS